jgi:hypothetical protein
MIVNQCLNFVLSSIKIVEFEMTTDRFVFSKRSDALVSAVISVVRFTDDESDANDEMIDSRTLRIRSWVLVEMMWINVGFRFENPHRAELNFSDEEWFDVSFIVSF